MDENSVKNEEQKTQAQQSISDQEKKELIESIGLTVEQVQAWKDQYRFVEMVKFGDKYYVYRALNRKEYRDMMDSGTSRAQNEERAMRKCVLFPKLNDIDISTGGPAGLPSALSTLIMEISQFAPEEPPVRL